MTKPEHNPLHKFLPHVRVESNNKQRKKVTNPKLKMKQHQK